ncbi:GNAT family N-acetyltransferase [Flavobacterium sp. Sd200]|uniref:GNAT family N-acetyltransferase n=1 Tax=Flavobacterium sp. Sd200 TaxID=2692211 RepID=UPI0013714C48|nr:GNAT family N-acetyltransferase [Flavobacterium sp. Sd200]MXN90070.1 GNAT family N-acetyltransferase [Flavobacterium sp. Sd200]
MLQSARLIYRELLPSDDVAMFELDSNPNVHRYLGNNPVTDIEQSRAVIAFIRQQYITNGVGRMAVILKDTGEFIGWAGLKLESNVNGHDKFYDVGYRFIERFWGNGYATEAAIFFVNYGFEALKLDKINASALSDNIGSVKALQNAGLRFVETYDYKGEEAMWLEIVNPDRI